MTKAFYISLASLIVLAVLDLLSFRNQKPSDSIDQFYSFVESRYDDSKERLLEPSFLELVQKDSITTADLRELRSMESSLEEDMISAKLSRSQGPIFWTRKASKNADCRNFKLREYQLSICQDLFDERNKLKQAYYGQANVHHQLALGEISVAEANWNGKEVLAQRAYRSYRINNVLVLAYLLAFIVLVWQCFKINSVLSYSLLAVIRAPLLFFPGWHNRFENSSLIIDLFEWRSYSSMDLVLDSIIIFCVLLKLASLHRADLKLGSSRSYLLVSAFFLSLAIISHIRLIQHVALCDSFNITINDISSINIPEASIFLALILILTGIFIYSTHFIKKIKSKLPKNQFYLSILGIVILNTCLAVVLHLNVHAAYMSMFLLCYFILIDLFVDLEQKSVTWIIWWAIFFGMYLSSCFFNYDIQKQTRLRQDFLYEIFNDLQDWQLEGIAESNLLDSLNDELQELIILPDEANYNKSDIENYLSDKFNSGLIHFDVARNGELLFGNWPGIDRCFPIQNYHLDEIENILWLENQVSDTLSLYSGYQIADPTDIKYPLLITRNGEHIFQTLNAEAEELDLVKASLKDQIRLNSKIYIRYQHDDATIAYSLSRFESLVKPIALFSYLFTSIILIFLLVSFLSRYSKGLKADWPLILSQFQSLNSRIQSALILVILLSFIFIAAVTSSFIISFINSKNNQFITEKLEILSNDLESKLASAESTDEAMIIASNYKDELEQIHNTDIKVYDFKDLHESSKFFPFAYFNKAYKSNAYSEDHDEPGYLSYFPIRHMDSTLGYLELNISSNSVQGFNIYDFLGSIFNVYVFLFLVASVFAILIAKSITKPLSLLNQKLSALRLGKRNELVNWDRDDEMGTLINNYNNMVKQLESSVELLAKTERDNAWREMAKQVAHEIKNPLTPMKMYIQHLEKAIKQQPERAAEISKKISATLLEQVENLTQIADSFSNFAELPQSSNEKLELNKVVELVHNLFRKRDDMDIRLSEPIDPVYVYADKNQLIRILNNLVKNAIESIPKDRNGIIHLELYTKNNKAIVKVMDNGSGIAPDMAEKIFQPKFTTKDSGSGLGLAIAMNMIESMNGRLYFNSTIDEGTSFFIELDEIRKKFDQEEERIILE